MSDYKKAVTPIAKNDYWYMGIVDTLYNIYFWAFARTEVILYARSVHPDTILNEASLDKAVSELAMNTSVSHMDYICKEQLSRADAQELVLFGYPHLANGYGDLIFLN